MKNSIHYRFIERDYLYNKMRSNTTYISDEQINNYLDELDSDDITFIFTPTKTGYKTRVIDNHTEQQIELEELNTFAWNYYLNKVAELSMYKAKAEYDKSNYYINKIKEMLFKGNNKKKYAKAN